jgi:hypothetical protein
MAATTSGTKTVTHPLAPHLSAAVLTALLAIPLESLTIAQLNEICDALNRVADGKDPARTIGSLLV